MVTKRIHGLAWMLLLLASPVWADVALVHKAPAQARVDQPLQLDFAIDPVSGLQAATVVWRPLPGGPWQRAPIRLSSTGVWRATLPAEAMTDPGIAYYVTAVDRDGKESAQFGTPEQPHAVLVRGDAAAVEELAALRELRGMRSELRLSGETVDYRLFGATAGTAQDTGPRYSDFQVAYRYWLLHGVEYIKAGVGRLRGQAQDTGSALPLRIGVGFDRGWTEVGMRASEMVGLAGRLVLGGDETTFRVGVAGILRIGKPQRTRVVFEAGATSGVGYHVQAGFHLETVPRWPIALEIILTNEPNSGNDSGERARLRVGHEVTPGLLVGLIASYQALSGDDHGLGAGLEARMRF
jgi:hypothetical protein